DYYCQVWDITTDHDVF
nr:immunoglobulin light chain junction region [Macaca mulatta]MOV72091.1 immunoglobulin light chain junction region [Macaca mulatta]MOV72105.1 immunoglobulin light chain junction region [Macaca mulatta]MOV72157.1 immunoglobulin light chain junction region [Macaca mulatta]MOV72381.1 immunoglobulin light chain junction region [Macaca mulatta]